MPGDCVLVAVSGGPDSLCLLHLLWAEREARELGMVTAAHLDHGLRGEESAAEADWVAAWCAERGIACHGGRVDVAALAQGRSAQEAARDARYAFLERIADDIGAGKIATGHTRSDQAETVLGNILRGTGTSGLRGIPAQRGRIVRPLLDVPRADIEAYNAAQGLMPRRDSSNESADHYTRNRIRLELLPQLRRDYNGQVDDALVRLSEIAARDSAYLQEQAAEALASATVAAGMHRLTLDRLTLMHLHPALLRYVLRTAISSVRGGGQDIGYEPMEAICAAIGQAGASNFALMLPRPACTVRVSEAAVEVEDSPATQPGFVSEPLSVPGTACLARLGRSVTASWQDPGGAARVDADRVDLSSLHVRNWSPGDMIDPLGMGGRHKKLSDIFADAKVPRAERGLVPIVADARGIVWIAGLAVSERAKVTPQTTRVLYLSAGNGGGDVE